jgi:hypothetical protein
MNNTVWKDHKYRHATVSTDMYGNKTACKTKLWQTLNHLEWMIRFMDSMWSLWFNNEVETKQTDLRTATIFCTLLYVIHELTVLESSDWHLIICLLRNPKKWLPFSQQFTRGLYPESNEWSPHLHNNFQILCCKDHAFWNETV